MIFGSWFGLSSTKWYYNYDPWMEYATDDNKYGAADSAVAIYWENLYIPAGSVKTFSTTLGMGKLEDRKCSAAGQMVVNVTAPKKVLIDSDNPVPFDVSAVLDNSFDSSTDFSNIEVEISYPNDLWLAEGDKKQIIPILKKNDKELINWKFVPTHLNDVNVYDFVVSVKGGNHTSYLKAYVVAMPSFVDMPNVQYSYISPNKLYHEDKNRVIQIKGDNLNYLRDDPDQWEVYLKDPEGNEYIIGDQFVNAEDNSSIYVTIPSNFKIGGETKYLRPGTYGLGIRHNLIEGFYRENAIEISDDPAYMRRGFGTLLITSKNEIVYGFGGEPITLIKNYIHHFKGNQQPVVPQGEKELMRITGDIQKISSDGQLDIYSVIPKENPVYLGDGILRIIGENDEAVGQTAEMIVRVVLEDVVVAVKKASETSKIYYGKYSEPIKVYISTPNPPDFDIVLEPDKDTKPGAAVQQVYEEKGITGYITNADRLKLSFVSETADYTAVTAVRKAEHEILYEGYGTTWHTSVPVYEGDNVIHIRSFNKNGEWKEKAYNIICKTKPPAIMMNETTVEDGIAAISGLTDTDADVFINGQPAARDEKGGFIHYLSFEGKAFMDVEIIARDPYGNESKHLEQVMNDVSGEITGVAIEAEDSMFEGRQQRPRFMAVDASGERYELPDNYVNWWMASDDGNAVFEDGYLKALNAGQCVLAAELKVNDSYSFKDMLVVDIYPAPAEALAIEPAYVDSVAFDGLTGFDLIPAFNMNINDYVLEIPKGLESFSIIPETSLEGAIIEYIFNVQAADWYTVTYDGNGNTEGSVPVDNNVYKPEQIVTVLGNIHGGHNRSTCL